MLLSHWTRCYEAHYKVHDVIEHLEAITLSEKLKDIYLMNVTINNTVGLNSLQRDM